MAWNIWKHMVLNRKQHLEHRFCCIMWNVLRAFHQKCWVGNEAVKPTAPTPWCLDCDEREGDVRHQRVCVWTSMNVTQGSIRRVSVCARLCICARSARVCGVVRVECLCMRMCGSVCALGGEIMLTDTWPYFRRDKSLFNWKIWPMGYGSSSEKRSAFIVPS